MTDAETERFTALYHGTARDLLDFLLRRTQTPEDAADHLAETYLIAWRKKESIPIGFDDARPWLFGVARNVMHRSYETNQRTILATTELAEAIRADANETPPDDPVTRAIRRLSPVDQEIITMLSWDELTPREVGTILGLSPNVVRVRAHRARTRLRQLLPAVKADLREPNPTATAGREPPVPRP